MDSHSLQSLEFPRILHRLAGLTVTAYGRHLAETLLPISDPDVLRRRQVLLQQCLLLLDSGDAPPLESHHEIDLLLDKARPQHAILAPSELRSIAGNIRVTAVIRAWFQNRKDIAPDLADLAGLLHPPKETADRIDEVIDESDHVRDSASPELGRLRREILKAEEQVRRRLTSLVRELAKSGYTQEGDIISVKSGRAVIAVRDEYRSKIQGVVHHVSSSGATVFVEPLDILESNNYLDRLRAEEEREVARILAALTAAVRLDADTLEHNEGVLGELDLVHASAALGKKLSGVVPRVSRDADLHLEQARHPLLLLRLSDPASVVPLSLTLSRDAGIIVITGPNAGGKTVAMKTVGLLALMAHAGLAVPAAAGTTVPLLEQIFCDVGDQQSLEDDLSTFSSRIQRYKLLLELAGSRSLALLDEIGQGTDPQEGSAIATALLERLVAAGAFVVVTTHHTALKVFAQNTPGVINGSMAFDTERYMPTYRFQAGIPGSSFALELAEKLAMPADLLARAREMLGAERQQLDGLLRDLELKLAQARDDAELAAQARRSAEMIERDLRKKKDALEKDYRVQVRKRIAATEQSLKDANRRVEQAIREVKESQASPPAMREARTAAAEAYTALDQAVHDDSGEPAAGLRPGSTVMVPALHAKGVVESINITSGKVRVQINGKKIELTMDALSEQDQPPQTRHQQVRHVIPHVAVPEELDLRGMDRLDAEAALDHYLEAAVNAGHVKVTIIHGIGNGVLRSMTTDYLNGHPLVAAAQLVRFGRGSGGSTIVEFK